MGYEIQVGNYTYTFDQYEVYQEAQEGLAKCAGDDKKIAYLDNCYSDCSTKTEDSAVDTSELEDDTGVNNEGTTNSENRYLQYLDGLEEGGKYKKQKEEFENAYSNISDAFSGIEYPDKNSSADEIEKCLDEVNDINEALDTLSNIVDSTKRTFGGWLKDLVPGGSSSDKEGMLQLISNLKTDVEGSIDYVSELLETKKEEEPDTYTIEFTIPERESGGDDSTRDGQISTTSQSSSTGDCWLLSSINALSYTEMGQEIIEDALEYQENGTLVHLKGAGDYFISDEEVESASGYSSGDDDMLILELAIEKAREDVINGNIELPDEITSKTEYKEGNVLDSGSTMEALYYLTGEVGETLTKDEKYNEYYEEFFGEANICAKQMNEILDEYMESDGNYVLCASINESDDGEEKFTITDINGNEVEMGYKHAYSIKSADEDTVTIVNPWNSGEEIVLSRDVFVELFDNLTYLDLSKTEASTAS